MLGLLCCFEGRDCRLVMVPNSNKGSSISELIVSVTHAGPRGLTGSWSYWQCWNFLLYKLERPMVQNVEFPAIRFVEVEAREANAPAEAIKAAGDAAGEVVKSDALKDFKKTNNDEAAMMGDSRAASTVIDAAKAKLTLLCSNGLPQQYKKSGQISMMHQEEQWTPPAIPEIRAYVYDASRGACRGTCGGRFLVDGIKCASKSMFQTVNPEVMNSFNPELNWKSVTKDRCSKKSVARSLKDVAKVCNRSPKRVGNF